MTVHRGPFENVYAGHAALHSIGTGLILTLSHSLPGYSCTIRLTAVYSHTIRLSACLFSHSRCMSIFLLSGSLPVYSCTIRLTTVYSLTVRIATCLVLHYQAHILSLSGLLHVYSHSQACCLSILTLSGSLPVYSHSIRLRRLGVKGSSAVLLS